MHARSSVAVMTVPHPKQPAELAAAEHCHAVGADQLLSRAGIPLRSLQQLLCVRGAGRLFAANRILLLFFYQ
jgi:hypothetical protein